MSQSLEPNTLPALPLPDGVVLPGMVVTISAESDEAKAAAAAAEEGRELLLVPRIGERFAKVGAVATVESTGVLPGGTAALVVRATGRARLGAGVVGTGAGPLGHRRAGDRASRLRGGQGPRRRAARHARGPVRARSVTGRCAASCARSTPTTLAAWPTWSVGGRSSPSSGRSSSSRRST